MAETNFGGFGAAGAFCALHPDQRAQRTCTRCGNFMCGQCAEGGSQSNCPTCRQRLGLTEAFPLTRQDWTFSGLWDYCFELFKRDWVMLSVGALILMGVSVAAQAVGNILPTLGAAAESIPLTVALTLGAFLVQNVLQGIVGMGFMRMLLDVLQGRRAEISWMFSQVHKTGTYLGTLLVIALGAVVVIGLLSALVLVLLMPGNPFDFENFNPEALDEGNLAAVVVVLAVAAVPLAWLSLPLYLLQAELAADDHPTVMGVLRNCFAYARGQRLSILGVSMVNGLVLIAGMLACCVGFIPALALSSLLTVGLCLALRTGADTGD